MNAKQLGDLPAYPGQNKRHGENVVEVLSTGGMTIRQHFAMAAMQAILTKETRLPFSPEDDVKYAVRMADALLAELAKDPGESP